MKTNKLETIALVIFFSFVALYASWHFGRWYEFKRTQEVVTRAYATSSDTDYFIVSNDNSDGELATGRCFTPDGDSELSKYIAL